MITSLMWDLYFSLPSFIESFIYSFITLSWTRNSEKKNRLRIIRQLLNKIVSLNF